MKRKLETVQKKAAATAAYLPVTTYFWLTYWPRTLAMVSPISAGDFTT